MICVLNQPSASVVQQVKINKADKRKQTIERANSSKSEKSQEQTREKAEIQADREEKNVKTERKKA
jgi:hypothetical protein